MLGSLFVLLAATACGGGGGANVKEELEKRGYRVVSCGEVDPDGFTACQLEGPIPRLRHVDVVVHEGKVFVVKSV